MDVEYGEFKHVDPPCVVKARERGDIKTLRKWHKRVPRELRVRQYQETMILFAMLAKRAGY